MRQTIYRFDMTAFHSALDERRLARALSWAGVAAEINRPFQFTTSIPINPATLREMPKKQTVASAVVLQVLRWLQRTPESFLDRPVHNPKLEERLPDVGLDRILRFDTRAMYVGLDDVRETRGLTWQQTADELQDFTGDMLKHLAAGPLIGFPRVMSIPQWIGCPASAFVRSCSR